MRRILIAVILLIALPASAFPISVAEFHAAGSKRIASIEGPDLPGFAYAIVENGVVAELGGGGVKRLGQDDPIGPDTAFLVGSISKSFTALAVMQLVEAGKVDLEASVDTYLPSLEGTDTGGIPVIRLLNHTSGFSTAQGNTSQTDLSEDKNALARRVAALADIRPEAEPGDRFEYSNANYQLLGRVIEEVSGMNYADFVETNIMAPAGMEDSFVHPGPRSIHLATGHRYWFGFFRPDNGNLTGAGSAPQGGVVSSARDMGRYLTLMMNGEDDILSAESKAMMMSANDPVAPNYGFGWNVEEDGRVWHPGSNPGYDAIATMLPSEGKASVVLINALGGIAFGQTVPLRLGLTKQTLDIEGAEAPDPRGLRIFMISLGIVSAAFLLGLFRIWRRMPFDRPKAGWKGKVFLVLPLLLTLVFAYAMMIALPQSLGGGLGAAWLYAPDLTLLLVMASGLALVWGVSRTIARVLPRENRKSESF